MDPSSAFDLKTNVIALKRSLESWIACAPMYELSPLINTLRCKDGLLLTLQNLPQCFLSLFINFIDLIHYLHDLYITIKYLL